MRQVSQSVPESLIKYESEIELTDEGGRTKRSQPVIHQGRPSPEDILNTIIPPREWTSEGKSFIQYVSHASVSRQDATKLQNLLVERLRERQAREGGICPLRMELYSQCFDELIRQVTIDSPERGLLLLRVRDQLKMTLAAYQTLYMSGVSFGMQKQIKSLNGIEELREEIREEQQRKQQLSARRIQLLNKKESVEKKIKQRQQLQESRMKEELEFLKFQATGLETFLTSLKQAK